MLALSSLKVSTISDEPFVTFLKKEKRRNKNSENSFLQKRSTDFEAAHGRPKFLFMPRCTLEYGLQRCVGTLKSECIFWEKIEVQNRL